MRGIERNHRIDGVLTTSRPEVVTKKPGASSPRQVSSILRDVQEAAAENGKRPGLAGRE